MFPVKLEFRKAKVKIRFHPGKNLETSGFRFILNFTRSVNLFLNEIKYNSKEPGNP
jgi:hypothetical protein